MSEHTLEIALWIVAGAWAFAALAGLGCALLIRELPEASTATAEPPHVTAVVPARDEAERIGTTVERLLAQRGVRLRIVVVDDRSTDDTSAIVARLAEADDRLELARIDELPEGWIGKCNACHVGAARAGEDEWILFTDADVWLAPDTIARAVRSALRDRVDHVTLFPGFGECSFWGRAALLACSLPMLTFMARTNLDLPRSFVGVGAFNLVRTEAYRAIGAHERLRMEVLDDVKLGMILRAHGRRSRACFGARDAEVHWARSIGDIVRVLRKNAFSLVGFNTLLGAMGVLGFSAVWLAAIAGPLTGTAAGWAALGGLWATSLYMALLARRHGWPLIAAAAGPLLFPVLAIAMAASMRTILHDGGVRWRETFYPLPKLRQGVVRWSTAARPLATPPGCEE
ncbi:MAG: glycosyltransferase [Phycisphaeraceae bacterium]|nr:MAG: glycosyltransferase [Phycisphaeraceae bacterium]